MRKITPIVCAALILLASLPGPLRGETRSREGARLEDLIREALENNPRLEAAVQRTRAAQKAVPQAGALPDPQLTFGLMNLPADSLVFNQEPMTGKLVSIMQMFPFPGKQALAEDMASFEAAAIRLQEEEMRNMVVQMVKRAWHDLYAVDRALETVEKNKHLMEQLVRIVETKYATGSGLQQDVLRAQVELSKIEDDLIMWHQKRLAASARLNALLDRPAAEAVAKIPAQQSLSAAPLQLLAEEEILKRRPLLRAWDERVRKTEAAVGLVRRDLWPNITVGASYSQRDDLKNGARLPDFLSATVSMNIPLYSGRKQKVKVAEKTLELAAVRSESSAVRAEVLADIEILKAEIERNRKRVALYEGGILLQARNSLESARAGYSVGKVDFLTLVNNWMMLQLNL